MTDPRFPSAVVPPPTPAQLLARFDFHSQFHNQIRPYQHRRQQSHPYRRSWNNRNKAKDADTSCQKSSPSTGTASSSRRSRYLPLADWLVLKRQKADQQGAKELPQHVQHHQQLEKEVENQHHHQEIQLLPHSQPEVQQEEEIQQEQQQLQQEIVRQKQLQQQEVQQQLQQEIVQQQQLQQQEVQMQHNQLLGSSAVTSLPRNRFQFVPFSCVELSSTKSNFLQVLSYHVN